MTSSRLYINRGLNCIAEILLSKRLNGRNGVHAAV